MALPFQTDRGQIHSLSSQHIDGNWPFTSLQQVDGQRGNTSQTTSTTKNQFNFIPALSAAILGSAVCFIILCVLLLIPILQLAIGEAYRDQCSINPNIPVYLIVSGACGIATVVLILAISGVSICLGERATPSEASTAGCLIGVMSLIIFLMSIFLFIWFIVGSVWIFGANKDVVYNDPLSPNYCHRTLYQFAFAMLILGYVGIVIRCCCSSTQVSTGTGA